MISPMTLAEIARASGATPVGAELVPGGLDAPVEGPVVADSREAGPGSLFVADGRGHDFAGDACARGAVAVLASRPLPGLPCLVAPAPDPAEIAGSPAVDASVVALGRLARAVRDRLTGCTVVAITGSQGKTTTKDLIAHLLGEAGPTVSPLASLNNELGVPLTLLRADAGTAYLVLEMGARGIGQIRALARIAAPRIGAVLNVGLAHVGEFGSQEAIATAKGELVEALPPAEDGGRAVLNGDDPYVSAMAGRTRARVVDFGRGGGNEVGAEDVRVDEAGRAGFRLRTPEGSARVALRLVGTHQVLNAVAAAAVARAAGLGVEAVAAGLSEATARARWRMEVSERPDGVTIVNDAYNANPDSTRAAIETVCGLARGRRTWLILGEMLELGAMSAREHEMVGRFAARSGMDRVVAVGDGARAALDGARDGRSWGPGEEPVSVADREEALALLRAELAPTDVVLVKSSRDSGLRHLGDTLAADAPADVSTGRTGDRA